MKSRKVISGKFPIGLYLAVFVLAFPPLAAAQAKIAFTSNREGNYEIYVMNADGSNQTRLTNNPSNDVDPSFTSDGSKVAFVSERAGSSEIYVMNADGSNLINLTNNPATDFQPTFSPDGSKIAFVSDRDGDREIYIMNSDGSNLTRLTYFSTVDDMSPSFSPDGSKIAFMSHRENARPSIFVMNVDGSNQVRLTNPVGYSDNEPSFSSDGSKIAFSRQEDFNWHEVWIMNADGSEQTRLTNNAALDAAAAFSPDGSKIAFVSDRDSNAEIYVMNPDGSAQTRLTFASPAIDTYPSWFVRGGTSPPILSNVAVSSPVDENGSAVLTGNLGSPNVGDSFTLTVNWGDGSPAQVFYYPAGTTSFVETHQYRDDNPTATSSDNYAVSLTLTTAGGSATDSAQVTVNNVAPTLSNLALNPSTTTAGQPVALSGNVGDVGTQDSHIILIDWGDGSPATTLNLATGATNFNAPHTYNAAGSFTITVTATDDDGGTTSDTLNTNSTPPASPVAPTNLRVEWVGVNQINLRWDDNSNNEAGFVVERCKIKTCSNFVQIGQTGANVATFTDTGLFANTQYIYRVRAFNLGGSSAYSNTVTARTLRR